MTIETIKFSQMTDGGDIDNNKKVPGLKDGVNVLFNNPWTFLPSGTTAQRPTPSAEVNFRLRLNTDVHLYEYYDAVLGSWIQLQASAVIEGPFITYTDDASLPDAQNLGALANGILKQTITLGVATLDIAVNGTDYWAPGDALTRTQVPLIGDDVTNKTYVDAQIAGSVVSLEGTANQVLVNGTSGSPQTGVLVLTTPQDIAPASTPSFAGLTMSGNISLGGVARTTNALEPVNPSDYATKFYVDQNSLNGTQVYAASAGSLGTVTQSGSGVGATLTNAGVQATFALDGVNPPLNSVVLIKDNATGMTAANQGIYTVSNVGSGATNWVLTRSTSYDTTTEINNTGLIVVQNGSTLQGTAWYNTSTIVTVDTTNFNYMEFGNITFPISLAHGGTNANLTASNGGIVYSTSTELAILSGIASASHMLLSGNAAAPTWSTSTIPTSAGAVAGKALVSDGTNYILSSFAFPTSVGATGTILRSDGTDWVATTATYPATTTINRILFSSANNVIGQISTVNSAGLLTDGSGVPGWVAYTGTGAPVLGTSPTITTPYINAISDQTFQLPVMAFTGVATAVNYIATVNSVTGVAPGFQFSGSDSNVSGVFTAKGTGGFTFYNNLGGAGQTILHLTGVASAVNYLDITNSATAGQLGIIATGTDSNINYITATKGTGTLVFANAGGAKNILTLNGGSSVVNYINIAASNTAVAPTLSAVGSDTDIGLNLAAKGAGIVTLLSGTVTAFAASSAASAVNYAFANGSATGVAVTLGAAGTDTNIQMVINSKGTSGVAIKGISTNTAQTAGYVGELLSATNLASSPIVFTNGVAKTLQTVTLTPGNWIVWGNIFWSGTTAFVGQAGIHTTTNVMPDNSLISFTQEAAAITAIGMIAPQRTFSVSSNTPVYLVGIVNGTGTLNGSGGIYALRTS